MQSGGDGVAEDVNFHRAIAEATRNPFLIQTLGYLSQFLHGATQVTRANEARRGDFAAAVRSEHQAILQAVQAGDPVQARQAAAAHMGNAIGRIRKADYNPTTQQLDLHWDSKTIKAYKHVPHEVFRRLCAAPNPTTYWEDRIAEEYPKGVPMGSGGASDAAQKFNDLFGNGS